MPSTDPSLIPEHRKFDEGIEDELERWVEAKRSKDFKLADRIRSDLRRKGVDPDTVRPAGRDALLQQGRETLLHSAPVMSSAYALSPEVEAKLDRWVAAKREKDFGTADAIRSELRTIGVEPDNARPFDKETRNSPALGTPFAYAMPGLARSIARYDSQTEAKLDRWVAAMRDKDFPVADSIRGEMRLLGIEPADARPSSKDLQSKLGMLQQLAGAQVSMSQMPQIPGVPATPRYAPDIEAQLDRWVTAKREKDFKDADAIRSELRALGVEPDTARPSDKDLQKLPPPSVPLMAAAQPVQQPLQHVMLPAAQAHLNTVLPNGLSPGLQREIDRQLGRWVEAKRAGDIRTLDEAGSMLRNKGFDPEAMMSASDMQGQMVSGEANPPERDRSRCPRSRIGRSRTRSRTR